MSIDSAAVAESERFMVATYLNDLIRMGRPSSEPAPAIVDDTPPFAPISSFAIGDEVIECEVAHE